VHRSNLAAENQPCVKFRRTEVTGFLVQPASYPPGKIAKHHLRHRTDQFRDRLCSLRAVSPRRGKCPDAAASTPRWSTLAEVRGILRLSRVASVLAIREVASAIGIAGGRVLRRWNHAKGLSTQVKAQRAEKTTGRVYYRSCRHANDCSAPIVDSLRAATGPVFASQLARYLASLAAIDTADRTTPYRQIDDQLWATIPRLGLQPRDRSASQDGPDGLLPLGEPGSRITLVPRLP
jgi:hypothetical protein